jgi:S1-C subfamily serine protease
MRSSYRTAARAPLAKQREVIEACERQCDTLNSLVATDAKTGVERVQGSGFSAQRTSVGLVLSGGCTIDCIVVGSPASRSKQLVEGDIILQVDGIEATDANISALLRGTDEPDSACRAFSR